MVTTRRQSAPATTVLAEVTGGFCEHDGIPARCPSCRAAGTAPDPPPPTTPRPDPPAVAEGGHEDVRDTPWWQR